jgi:hypothetical protein
VPGRTSGRTRPCCRRDGPRKWSNPPPDRLCWHPYADDRPARWTIKDGTTYYDFLIKNNGPAPAPLVHAYKEAQTNALIGPGCSIVGNSTWSFSLGVGQSQPVEVKCTPPTGHNYAHGSAMVWMDNTADPNTNNNVVTIQ